MDYFLFLSLPLSPKVLAGKILITMMNTWPLLSHSPTRLTGRWVFPVLPFKVVYMPEDLFTPTQKKNQQKQNGGCAEIITCVHLTVLCNYLWTYTVFWENDFNLSEGRGQRDLHVARMQKRGLSRKCCPRSTRKKNIYIIRHGKKNYTWNSW